MQIITTQTTVYSFDELSKEAQQKAIEKECEIISEYWTGDFVLDTCTEWLNLLGFYGTKIYYSGFWSQGDGACFIGKYSFDKNAVDKITTDYPQFTELQDIAKRLQELQQKVDNSLVASISQRGMYCHENSMEFHIDMDTEEFNCEAEELFIIVCQDIAKMIYNYIYKCYEYDTSEESAKENILANDYEFLIDGTIY